MIFDTYIILYIVISYGCSLWQNLSSMSKVNPVWLNLFFMTNFFLYGNICVLTIQQHFFLLKGWIGEIPPLSYPFILLVTGGCWISEYDCRKMLVKSFSRFAVLYHRNKIYKLFKIIKTLILWHIILYFKIIFVQENHVE